MARVAFLGSPEPAVQCLAALVEAGHDVALVVTEPDKRRGRGSATAPTPVKRLAADLGIPVTDRIDDVLGAGVDLGVVVAFGRLIRPVVLDRLLMVNVHFSLLPRWRGAAPVERAILAGDDMTGVCLMQLDEGLDTGPVYARVETPILPGESAKALGDRLAALGSALLVESLSAGVSSLATPVPQSGEPTYAAKIAPAELRIDWSRTAVEIERLVRVGRAWTTFRGSRLILWEASLATGPASPWPEAADPGHAAQPGSLVDRLVMTGDGWLRIALVQVEGRQRQDATAWLRGARMAPGDAFA
ncbi:MAG: methionyl-tRNA formyltransferase [Acidimicrobiales bacterium]